MTTWIWTQGDPDIAGQETRLVVRLDPEDTGTRVTVRQSGFSTEEARRRNAEGWDRALEGLAEYLTLEVKFPSAPPRSPSGHR